jgi:prepilin-type N-terminal cleavage/methylation domain-containing protein/prepilin-type processing-associated H-X9-DG protein
MAVRARSARAFTLIEVLVVVAIIALLVAVLMPALAAAKHRARMVVCATNLHTIGRAIFYYAQASKDELPAGYRLNDKTKKYEPSAETFEFLYPFVQKVGVKQGNLVSGSAGYILKIPSYSCPEDREQHTTESKKINATTRVEIALSYGVNSSILVDNDGRVRKLASIKNPSSIVAYLDAGDDQRSGDTGWVLADGAADFNNNQCFFELRHRTGNQFLYLDGHVSFSQAMHLSKPKVKNDRENYGLPPYPSAFIPNWGPTSPDFATKDARGHDAPVRTAWECGADC